LSIKWRINFLQSIAQQYHIRNNTFFRIQEPGLIFTQTAASDYSSSSGRRIFPQSTYKREISQSPEDGTVIPNILGAK
jgi:hypothetical protein